jgi:hypothetical protein
MRRCLLLLVALSCWLVDGDAAIVTKWLVMGTQTTLLSTELNSLGNNNYTSASSAIDFSVGQANRDGYLYCSVEGKFAFLANPTASTSVTVWLLGVDDGTNYEDTPTSAVGLGRLPDVVLPVTTGQTATRVRRVILCPKGSIKAVAKNDGTGQAMASSGNTIKVLPFTAEGIAQ